MTYLSGIYSQTPLNTTQIPQSLLNIDKKVRSNPLKWKGQFSPQLVQVLLNRFASKSSLIFDPFLGSGTILLEAGLANKTACGTEINPAAVILAKIYEFININREYRRKELRKINYLLNEHFQSLLPISDRGCINSNNQLAANEIKSNLLRISRHAMSQLSRHAVESLIILVDFHKEHELSQAKIFKTWAMLSKLILELPYSSNQVQVFHSDARCAPLDDSSVDLVLTSPPYINVFNYHQQYRRSAECLDWDVLRVARSEFGANRKHRGNRFLTVTQYCLDLTQVLVELNRVCHESARLIFVVGRESKVRGTPFYNGEIVAELAYALDYSLITRQERVFRNRFGQQIYEDILHFTPSPQVMAMNDAINSARQVAQNALEEALSQVPDIAADDLRSAIDKVAAVLPSPQFDSNQALNGTQLAYV